MKIVSIRLINYIGIANGTGLHELYIDFTPCKTIIAVVGHNGSGKSTLLKSLHPFPDGYDMLIPNCEAYKEIKYLKDNHMYEIKIKYTYMENKKTTEIGVFKDNINLNPNLNVTSAKDIIMNEFELDSNYIALSQLSSEDRGLADKKPSERKKFVNDILADLSVYNTMYKTLNKKSSNYKNLINNLSYKINNIGGDNLPLLESNVQQLESQLQELEKQKEAAITEQTTINNAIDLHNEVNKECLKIKEDYQRILQEHSQIIDAINIFKSQATTDFCVEWKNKDLTILGKANMEKLNAQLVVLNGKINTLTETQTKVNMKLQAAIGDKNLKQQQLNSIQTDNIDTDSFVVTIKDLETKKNNIEKAIESKLHKQLLNSKNTSMIVYTLYQELEDIASEINQLVYYKNHTDVKQFGNMNDIIQQMNDIQTQLINDKKRQYELKQQTISIPNLENIDGVPKDCHNKKCYFCNIRDEYIAIKDKINAQNLELQALDTNIKTNTEKLDTLKEQQHELNTIVRYNKILERNNRLLSEIETIKSIKHSKEFSQDVANTLDSISKSLDIYNILDQYHQIKDEYSRMTEQYMIISNNLNLIDSLRKDIKKLDIDIASYQTEYNDLEQQIQSVNINLQLINKQLDDVDSAYKFGIEFDRTQTQLLQYKAEYDKFESTIHQINILQDKAKAVAITIENLNKDISTVKQNYDNTKYNARLLKEYKQEYDVYINDFQKIETIKRFTSPTTGIQTLFMETYMNNVLVIANQLLSIMFNGEFALQPFIINENEFRIPCAGSGYLNDDISSMSTAQICMISMIISFAMLYNSSSCYNILKLDEIDSALDNDNRINFVNMLDQIMHIMNCEQCFIISHNMELDESQVTKIDMNSF